MTDNDLIARLDKRDAQLEWAANERVRLTNRIVELEAVLRARDTELATARRRADYQSETAQRLGETVALRDDEIVDLRAELAAAEHLIAGTVMTVDEFGLDADTLSIHVDRMRAWLASVSPPADREEP